MHRPWPYPRVVGHRGAGTLAPENTLAGIRKAAAMGFGGVEFDVMLSADKVPLLIHDETLDRTTRGRGSVAATPYARLASLDAGAWFSPEYRGARCRAGSRSRISYRPPRAGLGRSRARARLCVRALQLQVSDSGASR